MRFNSNEMQHLSGFLDQASFLARDRGQAEHDGQRMLTRLQMQADENIVEHRPPGENAGLLESAHDPEGGDAAWLKAVEARVAIDDVAGGRRQIAGNGVEG